MSFQHARNVALAASAVLATGCATAPGQPDNELTSKFRQTFASDDPCSNNARNIGIAGGTLLGLIIGNSIGDGKSGALVAGALVGGMVGGLIGSDMDRKRCELSKVAKQYDLDMTFSTVNANGEVQEIGASPNKTADSTGAPPAIIGSTVTVRDKEGVAGHFESGSDRLTPKAREYFAAIAAQYSGEKMLTGQTDPKRREELGKQLAQRRLFLMGHTDDTGSSQLNATLSERRAKAVAGYLKQQGIPENALYFQGAGETLPIADNRTDTGRAANRRVEIVEVADEASFKKYLEARKPNYQFYRPADVAATTGTGTSKAKPGAKATNVAPTVANAGTPSKPEKQSKVAASTQPSKTPTVAPARTPTATAKAAKAPLVNFGGTPYSPQQATLNVGSVIPEKSGFGLISKAYADDTVVLSDCTRDRPRAAGSVKSLHDGSTYKTNEHMPQLFGKTWAGDVNGNLVVINHLAVLRDGGTPANLPELKVYAQYKPGASKKPEVNEEPRVNSYLVGQGVLYRMFPRGDAGLKCVDVLFATDGSTTAKGGKLIYTAGAADYIADFKPQLQ
jgi:outer membrane protein OmpA-like peptidoglycan-associated protein